SQGGEFLTLAEAGITSLNLAHTLKNQSLANGNTLAREGSFTRADGSTSGMGEFHLAIDTFDTQFATTIDVPDAIQPLPNMQGAGKVRELHQAAAQSGSVQTLLEQFAAAPARAAQHALLEPRCSPPGPTPPAWRRACKSRRAVTIVSFADVWEQAA
ncbi:MAG: hypothetical protein IDH49_15555, partial [Gammaproteobacteria bacterium]|nr:hypothetical protein [Gammaproteobacteria bacterium]